MAAEIISTVERRRRWPAEDKLRIMSEALEPGAMVASVADRDGVCAGRSCTLGCGWRGTTGCLASRSRPSPPLRSFRFASGRSQRRHRATVRLYRRRRTPVLRLRRAVSPARLRSFSAMAARSKSTRALIRRRSPGSSMRSTKVARDYRPVCASISRAA
jgi:hypothetical protein